MIVPHRSHGERYGEVLPEEEEKKLTIFLLKDIEE